MTVKEAKNFLTELEQQILNESIDIFAKENEEICTKFFRVIRFALGNLVPNIEDSDNKCKSDCPFFVFEHRELCEKLSKHQNCYQCIVTEHQMMKLNFELLSEESSQNFSRARKLEKENAKLRAKIYDLMNPTIDS